MTNKILQAETVLFSLVVVMLFSCGSLEEDRIKPTEYSARNEVEGGNHSKASPNFNYRLIEETAYNSNINFSHLKINRPRENQNTREGFTDRMTKISTVGKRGGHRYSIHEITRFIELLEGGADDKKVTDITIGHPSEDRKEWGFALEITQRLPLSQEAGKSSSIPPLYSVFSAWNAVFDTVEKTGETSGSFDLDSLKIDVLCSAPSAVMSGEIDSGKSLDTLIAKLLENSIFPRIDYPDFTPDGEGWGFYFRDMRLAIDLVTPIRID